MPAAPAPQAVDLQKTSPESWAKTALKMSKAASGKLLTSLAVAVARPRNTTKTARRVHHCTAKPTDAAISVDSMCSKIATPRFRKMRHNVETAPQRWTCKGELEKPCPQQIVCQLWGASPTLWLWLFGAAPTAAPPSLAHTGWDKR